MAHSTYYEPGRLAEKGREGCDLVEKWWRFMNVCDAFFTLFARKAGLHDIRFHNLRHSPATLLLSKGVHPKVVQEILGHSEISTTMDTYSHVLPTMQKHAMNELNDIFGE